MNFINSISVSFFAMICVHLTEGNEDTSSLLNNSCQSWKDCGDFGYYCDINMTCQCTDFYIPDATRKKCTGGIGQKCAYDDDCIERAFCEKQTMCKCKKKYHPTDNGLLCVRNTSNNWKWEYWKLIRIIAIVLFTVRKIS